MKEQYNRFMDNLTPERSDEELFTTVLARAEKRENIKMTEKKILKKAVMIPIAAAMAITLSIAGGAAIYSGFSHLRQSEIAQSPEVAQSIQTEVFSDSTEHIKMTVEEYVSDGISAFATVKYEALDEIGKEWLSYKRFDNSVLCLLPCTMEYGSHFGGVSHWIDTREIKELKTENERYFMITLGCESDEYDGGIAFKYTMGINGGSFEIPMEKQTVEIKSYALSAKEQASKYFIPTHLKISDLSFVVYGENHGVYKGNRRASTSTISKDDNDKLLMNMKPTLIMSDGQRIEPNGGATLGPSNPCESNLYTDLIVCSGDFSEYDYDKEKWIYHSMDIGDIAGIEICGVYFEATEIE